MTRMRFQNLPTLHPMTRMAKAMDETARQLRPMAIRQIVKNKEEFIVLQPKKRAKNLPPSSPLNALLDGEWTATFTPDWESCLPAILNGNVTIHSIEESKQVEDFELMWMERSKTKIVLVVVVKTDQRFERNSRSRGALVQYEDGKVTRTKPFPLSYHLHFKSTVATIAIAVDYGVQLDKDIEIYTVHYHAIDKALGW